jgi:Ribbon-helix-helix protein, copG family
MVSARMSRELAAALNAAARVRRTTRSALLRAMVEDLVDLDDVPSMRPFTSPELIDEQRRRDDEELARLNAIAAG